MVAGVDPKVTEAAAGPVRIAQKQSVADVRALVRSVIVNEGALEIFAPHPDQQL